MKLLFYNWADCCSREGGGVTVYLKSLLDAHALREHDLSMISSGMAYTLSGRHFWRQIGDKQMPRVARYEIVNSMLLAPALCAFGSPYEADSPKDVVVFQDFITKIGPFAVIHFHNLEGISREAIKMLRRNYPQTKLVFSLHNYFPFCSQVNLYLHKEHRGCQGFNGGRRCVEECRRYAANFPAWQKLIKMYPALSFFRGLPGYRVLKLPLLGAASACRSLFGQAGIGERHFADRREKYIEVLNECFDLVLCVSERVREIACAFGLRPEILRTNYIGTSMSGNYEQAEHKSALPEEDVTLTYLGYANHDKGFFFLLDALSQLPSTLCNKIHLCLAARGCRGTVEELARKKLSRFRSLRLRDGYRRNELGELLAGTNIGILPQLWEDCLPQTAIEMHCHGIPLFCSDKGGAKELADCPDFVFQSGNTADFVCKLEKILTGQVDLKKYWEHAKRPPSIEEHAYSLIDIYTNMTNKL